MKGLEQKRRIEHRIRAKVEGQIIICISGGETRTPFITKLLFLNCFSFVPAFPYFP